jgi:hypothetical protein
MQRRARVRLTAPELVMAPERSHAHARLGHQLYPILEQSRKPEVLRAKLATGNEAGCTATREVRPGAAALVHRQAEGLAISPDDAEVAHRVEVLSPQQRIPR